MPQQPSLAVLITAAGRSERFGGTKKVLAALEGRSVLEHSLRAFLDLENLAALVITAPPGREEELEHALEKATRSSLASRLGPAFRFVPGGESRRDSVRLGLEALVPLIEPSAVPACLVLIHDAARPWASPALAARVAATAAKRGACVPVVPLVDTPKRLGADGSIGEHPRRASFGAAQTPQGFGLLALLEAHRRAAAEGVDCTDDAELWARYVGSVAWTEGEERNRKITFREDLDGRAGADTAPGALPFRIGQGWDIHRLVAGRRLMLGGVVVPSERGEEGHSDGDVLLHAVIDALLGAAALGDIGTHFPPADPVWKDADSRDLLRRTVALLRQAGWRPGNLDTTVILERPRLGPFREAICAGLADCLGLPPSALSFKAKTKEGLGATGAGEAVEATAVVTLFPL